MRLSCRSASASERARRFALSSASASSRCHATSLPRGGAFGKTFSTVGLLCGWAGVRRPFRWVPKRSYRYRRTPRKCERRPVESAAAELPKPRRGLSPQYTALPLRKHGCGPEAATKGRAKRASGPMPLAAAQPGAAVLKAEIHVRFLAEELRGRGGRVRVHDGALPPYGYLFRVSSREEAVQVP